ncbi:ATP-binding protein [Planomicrobium sp. CPCC 101079]|uniref:ATP-binding protein n=1 Tax=Planomicrobium sp. CPCC 101079 TaxID=2599618 RepID=UPI0011B3C5BB|nr:ATP-binding protein [Planomicrobium sp. CPCC 101079]TWT00563.1 GAF domain-containing protein [Planomicrobium sp. CPCC 101079]
MLGEQIRYSRLANITKIINTKLELREVLQHVTAAISEEIMQCSSVGVFLPQEDGTFRAYAGKPEVINGASLYKQVIDPKTDLLAKEVIETNKTIYIPDAVKDNRPDRTPVEALEIKSLLALPISFEQELYGLVFLFDYGAPMNLIESEIQSVEAYVNMAAVAIRNAKTLAQKESLIAEKQLLLDVTSDLSMCSSLQECMDKCFYYIGKVLNNNNMIIHLLDPVEKKIIRATSQSRDCNWTEAEWSRLIEKAKKGRTYENIIQEVIQTKTISHVAVGPCKGALLIPLALMREVIGVILVAEPAGEAPVYDESQIQLVQSIVDATAPTFSNLLYMDQLENMVEERTSELAAANEKVVSVIESITDGFFALNKEWEFIYINKHQYLPEGKRAMDVMGKNIWEIFPEWAKTLMYEEFHRAMIDRVPVHFEMPSTSENYWNEVVAYPYDEGICCLSKNIAEKKKYEKELRRLSNLDLIGQMAAGISHEIRNPMTTVRGFLQLLKQENKLDKHDVYFDVMIEELDRANAIITEFLSVGNTRTSDLQMLDLNAVIHDIAPLIKIDTFGQNKLIEFDTQDIPELLLNRNEIRQLIINLYRNALDAMEAGKQLTIFTYQEGENCIVLGVQDQGEGIRPEVLEKLGTPFYTTKDNGTGLGLGICYAIAARHNAKIEILTGPEGTTFLTKFYLKSTE